LRIVLCDRCGRKIAKEEPVGHITVYGEGDGYAQGNNGFVGWDFCPSCMASIDSFIKIPPEDTVLAADDAEEADAEEAGAEPSQQKAKFRTKAEIAAMYEAREKEAEAAGPGGLKGNRRIRPDWGKFKACVDAGKDNDWLAVEFGVEKKTISNWKWLLSKKIAEGKIK
jgi:hypothetical protein